MLATRDKALRDQQKPIIEKLYPTTNTVELAKKLNIEVKTLQKRAQTYGVKKSADFVSATRSEIIKKSGHGFKHKNIPKRHVPVDLLKRLKDNIKPLNENGQTMLANITSMIIERIKSSNEINFEFLTIYDGWGL